MEWWYFHCHLITDAGEEHGVMFAFIRHLAQRRELPPLRSHFVVVGHSDAEAKSLTNRVWMDSGHVGVLHDRIESDVVMDPSVRKALLDAFASGCPVPPDLPLTGEVRIDPAQLDLVFGEAGSLHKLPDGSYRAVFDADGIDLDLTFQLDKPPIPEGNNGILAGRFDDRGHDLFTYRAPRLTVQGRLGTRRVSGSGWFEHAFGGKWLRVEDGHRAPDRTWTRLGVQLDNGWEIAAASVKDIDIASGAVVSAGSHATAYSPANQILTSTVTLVPLKSWTSLATLNTYPVRLSAQVPELDLELLVEAEFSQQEYRTLAVGGAALGAWATVSGTMAGQPVQGRAFLESLPAVRIGRIEEFLGRLRDITNSEIRALYPDDPSEEVTAALAGEPATGLPHATVHEALVRPLRYLTDASGRGWRTFATCAAIELCGVSAEPYTPLLAVVEATHTGTLLVDDVQDGSLLRRGRPAAHTMFGASTAINAGTAAYLVLDRVVPQILPDDDRLRLRVYQTFLRALRAGHVGQGIDLAGHREAMDLAVTTGDPTALLDAVRGTLRLKSGAPARAFAEIGALIARATDTQGTAIGEYFEAVGLAYQITDDVMDLHGLTQRFNAEEVRATKHKGEDLRAGKVTMPLAHAIALLPHARMAEIWNTIRDGHADDHAVTEIAEALVDCGAVQSCYDEAKAHVDTAWARLDPLLPHSIIKIKIRALGFYTAMREHDPATPKLVHSG